MMGKALSIALSGIIAVGAASCSREPTREPGKQTTCPVMKGKTIDPNLYVEAEGKRIYACCPGCIVKIKADPDTYIKQLQDEGITLEKAPKKEDDKGGGNGEDNGRSSHQY
jgi:hypothetical protein